MSPATYDELNDLLNNLIEQRIGLEKQIEDNFMQIFEINSLTQEILNREVEDVDVFSPRKIRDIYRDELAKYKTKENEYENRNKELIVKKEKLDSIISVLEKVCEEIKVPEEISIQSSQQFSPDKNIEEEDILKDTIKNMKHLIRKTELSIKLIRQDPVRTKIELESVNKGMKKILDNFTVFTNKDI